LSYWPRAQVLRQQIRFVLRHLRFFLILDEAQFLVPQNYTKTTPPERLNYVRTELMEGLPLAMIHTPQTFSPDADRFVKKTGFAMEQFFGRVYRTVQAPDELPRADLLAVARMHLPELGDEYLEVIADLAELSENYLQTVEAVGKLARFIARREGHRRITISDIETARDEIIPRRAEPTPHATLSTAWQPSTRRPPARVAEGAIKTTLIGPGRAVQPRPMQPIDAPGSRPLSARGDGRVRERAGRVTEAIFESGSLRGAGPEKVAVEPMLAHS
jgi:hypothetical protein